MQFSVIVPTYDRPVQLAACLGALAQLRPPSAEGKFEIVLVNDGGTPPPSAALAMAEAAADLVVISQRNAGPAAARNAGARRARGRFLAFTDDDCRPEPDWLAAFARVFERRPDALLGGRTMNALTDNLYASASQLLVDFVTAYFDGGAAGRFFTSNNMAAPREAFLDAGGFDERFPSSAGEDREFSDRWWAQGRPSERVDDAVVHHGHELTLRTMVRQHFAYGRGAHVFRRLRADDGRRVRVDLPFYARSIWYPVARRRGREAPALALLTATAHAAYAAGLLYERRRAGRGVEEEAGQARRARP